MFENVPGVRNVVPKKVRGFKNASGVQNGVWELKGGSGGYKRGLGV